MKKVISCEYVARLAQSGLDDLSEWNYREVQHTLKRLQRACESVSDTSKDKNKSKGN